MSSTTIKTFVNGQIKLSCEPYPLILRSAFGTSHSSTTTRTNALIFIQVLPEDGMVGWGEVGLPPKKKHCYLADYDDIVSFFHLFCEHLSHELQHFQSLNELRNVKDLFDTYDAFDGLPSQYFELVRPNANQVMSIMEALPILLLKVLDTCEYVDGNGHVLEYRLAAQCGIEMAIFDLWGSLLHKPLYQIIGLEKPKDKVAFYTVALNENIAEYERSIEFGLRYSKHLKLKLDSDIEKSINMCKKVYEIYNKTLLPISTWSVDANSAWTPESTIEFIDALEKYPNIKAFMYMIEQPFPVDFLEQVEQNSELKAKWKQVKTECEKRGIILFADESVSTWKNIDLIKEYVHGVNFKLEKAGGIRGVLRGIITAKENNLKIWLGCMVSSRLSCTCSAHLLSLSEIGGDLDGDLLVKEESQIFRGGFAWLNENPEQLGFVALGTDIPGIGLTKK